MAICLRGYLHETRTNSDRYELVLVCNFYSGLHETGTECLVPDLEQNEIFCLINILTPKSIYLRLEICGPSLRFVVVYMRAVRPLTVTRVSHHAPATKTKSDQSEFIVRPGSCKCKKKKIMEADTNSCQSLSGFIPVSCYL